MNSLVRSAFLFERILSKNDEVQSSEDANKSASEWFLHHSEAFRFPRWFFGRKGLLLENCSKGITHLEKEDYDGFLNLQRGDIN